MSKQEHISVASQLNLGNQDNESVLSKEEIKNPFQDIYRKEPDNQSKKFNFEKQLGLTQEQKISCQDKVSKELKKINNNIDSRANETDTKDSLIYKKRKNALESVECSIEGIVDPNKELPNLCSRHLFISYSRRNEEEARQLSLAGKSGGMLTWFDNQEENVTLEGPSNKEENQEHAESYTIEKGIGLGTDYEQSIKNGIKENGTTLVLLTHDVLDKPNIVFGVEISETLSPEKNGRLILGLLDDPEQSSVIERLKNFTKENPENEKYRDQIEALLSSPILNLDKNSFSKPKKELGAEIINNIPKIDSENTRAHLPASANENTNNAKTLDTGSTIKLFENLKQHTPGMNSGEVKDYQDLITDCQIILQSQIDARLLKPEDTKDFVFEFANLTQENQNKYQKLIKSLEELGLTNYKKEKTGYKFCWAPLPLLKEDITLDPETFDERFGKMQSWDLILWPLVGPDFYPALAREITKTEQSLAKAEEDPNFDGKNFMYIQKKLQFLEKISKTQGIQIGEIELRDSQSLASYLLMKQMLVEREMIDYKVPPVCLN